MPASIPPHAQAALATLPEDQRVSVSVREGGVKDAMADALVIDDADPGTAIDARSGECVGRYAKGIDSPAGECS
jgi:hypothetical protein